MKHNMNQKIARRRTMVLCRFEPKRGALVYYTGRKPSQLIAEALMFRRDQIGGVMKFSKTAWMYEPVPVSDKEAFKMILQGY